VRSSSILSGSKSVSGSPPSTTQLDLSGRMARCACDRTVPSRPDLPNFEYRGPGSWSATEVCVCGYHWMAHQKDIRRGAGPSALRNCPFFRPRGDLGFDGYWCGCEAGLSRGPDGHPRDSQLT
jgi:hypothetical protein